MTRMPLNCWRTTQREGRGGGEVYFGWTAFHRSNFCYEQKEADFSLASRKHWNPRPVYRLCLYCYLREFSNFTRQSRATRPRGRSARLDTFRKSSIACHGEMRGFFATVCTYIHELNSSIFLFVRESGIAIYNAIQTFNINTKFGVLRSVGLCFCP